MSEEKKLHGNTKGEAPRRVFIKARFTESERTKIRNFAERRKIRVADLFREGLALLGLKLD